MLQASNQGKLLEYLKINVSDEGNYAFEQERIRPDQELLYLSLLKKAMNLKFFN